MKNTFKPSGYNSVSPYFIVQGAQKFVELIQTIFNAKELKRYEREDGSLLHAEFQLDDSVLMLSEANENYPPMPMCIHVYVANADETFHKAVKAGCEAITPPTENEGDPDRRGTFKDFAGNIWSVGTQM